jgi:hypothetical protein
MGSSLPGLPACTRDGIIIVNDLASIGKPEQDIGYEFQIKIFPYIQRVNNDRVVRCNASIAAHRCKGHVGA